jgi:hypothetical protein
MIRLANKHDLQDIIKLLKDFAATSDNAMTNFPLMWSKTYIEGVLASVLAGKGFILIDDDKNGLLVAVRNPCFWIENVYQLQEVMLHSKSKITMYRLIKEYVRIAREMLQRGEIHQAVMSSYKDDKFERIGLKKLEVHWSIE